MTAVAKLEPGPGPVKGHGTAGYPSASVPLAADKVADAAVADLNLDDSLFNLCKEHGEERVIDLGVTDVPPLRIRQLPFCSRFVVDTKGATLWPSGEVLAHFVARRLGHQRIRQRRVLELGCGVAPLAGLTAAHCGAGRVVITDLPEVIATAHTNAILNGVGDQIQAMPLIWGELPDVRRHPGKYIQTFDLLLAADVLYDVPSHDSLVTSMEQLAAKGGQAFIATQGRGTATEDFFNRSLRRRGWHAKQLDITEIFDVMNKGDAFRSQFGVWLCWRKEDAPPAFEELPADAPWSPPVEEDEPSPAFFAPADVAPGGGVWWEEDEDLPVAPPEEEVCDDSAEEEDDDDDIPLAPPESDED
eukprot:TRINITY_DN102874_c0_g1_i1.p1 TRINITY_DN102874_c0_g1~~TRINITY_DN102874_c0_g1_i1.p1  ORF type:complete len:370 (-),score=75.16 TRINITY_DN102874_c0_g1_i1:182-1258(-)